MLVSVKGVFKDGVAQPVETVEGREGQPVVITFVEDQPADQDAAEDKAAWHTLTALVESCAVETGISDLAHNHDHYLYGKAKGA